MFEAGDRLPAAQCMLARIEMRGIKGLVWPMYSDGQLLEVLAVEINSPY